MMPRGIIFSAVSPGYDRDNLSGFQEDEVETKWIELSDSNPVYWNRRIKIMNPPSGSMWTLYLDGSLSPKGRVGELVEGWLAHADMALFRHPHRSCTYAEIDACVARKKITAEQGEQARAVLRLAGFPRDWGLWACGMIARRTHLNPTQWYVAPLWWKFTEPILRDQIWLPFALWKIKDARKRIHTVDADIFDNEWFNFRKHRS